MKQYISTKIIRKLICGVVAAALLSFLAMSVISYQMVWPKLEKNAVGNAGNISEEISRWIGQVFAGMSDYAEYMTGDINPERALDSYHEDPSEQRKDGVYTPHEKGIFNGDEKGNFNASANLTRAEAVTALLALKGVEVNMDATISGFSDADGHWYTPYVAAAKAAGITAGYEDNTFKPDAAVTREEFVTMILAAKGIPANVLAFQRLFSK